MTVQQDEVREIPIRRDAKRFRESRLPLEELRDGEERLVRFRYPNGVVGWLVTKAEDFREILNDPRFHAKRFLGEPQPTPVSVSVPDMPGFIPSMNGPDHLRVRRLAAGDFSVKRMNAMRPFIQSVVDKHLDATERHGAPVDLYSMYCLPIPSEVIAGILGVPHTHTVDFQNAARLTIGGRSEALDDVDAPARAIARLHEIIGEVIELKRATPADDLITRLTHADPPLSDTEIKGLCTNLLLAGHETTATGSAVSIAILLERPDQLAAFLADPERLPESIEELNRFRTTVADSGSGIPRLCTEDIEYRGQLIRKGDWVMLSTGLANYDKSICPVDPLTLDLNRERPPGGNLTFGFGAHTCLGQHLARAEMQVILSRLFERFPNVRLEMPLDQMPWMDKGFGYRMAELMVSW